MSETEQTSTAPTSSLVEELLTLNKEYEENPDARTTWKLELTQEASDSFVNSLLASDEAWTLFQQSARVAAKSGKSSVRLGDTWVGRGPQVNSQFLSDLLDLGDLVECLQTVLDERLGEGLTKVFNHQIATNVRRGPPKYALVVSWNQEGFKQANEILAGNRERAEERLKNAMRRRDERQDGEVSGGEDEGSPRPRRRDRDDHDDRPRRNNTDRDSRPRRNNTDRDSRPRRNYGDEDRPRRSRNYDRDEGARDSRPRRRERYD